MTGRPNRGREKYVMSMLAKRLPAEIAQRRKQGLGHSPRRFAEQPVAGFIRELLLDGASAGGPLSRSYVEAHLAGWLDPRYREFGRPVMLMFLQSWWNEFFPNA